MLEQGGGIARFSRVQNNNSCLLNISCFNYCNSLGDTYRFVLICVPGLVPSVINPSTVDVEKTGQNMT